MKVFLTVFAFAPLFPAACGGGSGKMQGAAGAGGMSGTGGGTAGTGSGRAGADADAAIDAASAGTTGSAGGGGAGGAGGASGRGGGGGTGGAGGACASAVANGACASEGTVCGSCTSACNFCNTLRCTGGRWLGQEGFPAPCFACGNGNLRCQVNAEYCRITSGPFTSVAECTPVPEACRPTPTCACINAQPNCTQSDAGAGALTVTILAP